MSQEIWPSDVIVVGSGPGGATLEGLLLDPVYTGKAFAGLLDLAQKGRLGAGAPVIFVHTGGLPALFAFKDLLDPLGAASHRA